MERRSHATLRRTSTLGLIAAATCLCAQQPVKPYTLHVYARRIQVPTLVLTTDLKPVPPIPRIDFRITLDGGPAFLPTNMHLEGDRPLNLAVLLDASGNESALLKHFADSFASLAPADLHPQDRFSVYAVDCGLVSTPPDLPVGATALHSAITNALAYPTLHGKHSHSACAGEVHLWDAVARAIKDLSALPGPRVLLIVSTGEDHQSRVNWNQVNLYADLNSVAIFGMNDFFNFQPSSNVMLQYVRDGMSSSAHLAGDPDDPFKTLCESNGGVLFATDPKYLTQGLQSFIGILRGRYVLSFPEATKFVPGFHAIDVKITRKGTFFITTTGVTSTAPDENILNDPTTVPSTPSSITYGTHRPLPPN